MCKKGENDYKDFPHVYKFGIPDYQWIKLTKSFFGFPKDLFICVVYYPPAGSSYTKKLDTNILNSIEKDMVSYGKSGDFLICGDFNARLGESYDYIKQDDKHYLPLNDDYKCDKKLIDRHTYDENIDKRGKDLIEFCIGHHLRILNGRTLGDLTGAYTCFTPNGCSTVDYAILSDNILDSVLYFKVKDFLPTLSDCHCQIEWKMSAKFMKNPDVLNIVDDVKLKSVHPRYIWSDSSAHLFQEALSSNDIQTKIKDFMSNTCMNVNSSAEYLGNIFTTAADMSLKKQKMQNR